MHYKNAFGITVSKISRELSIVCNFQDSDDIVWLHYFDGTIPWFIVVFSVGSNFRLTQILVCISLLWRRKKLVLSPHRNLCSGFSTIIGLWHREHPWMWISSPQEDVRLALDHGVGVIMHDALRPGRTMGNDVGEGNGFSLN